MTSTKCPMKGCHREPGSYCGKRDCPGSAAVVQDFGVPSAPTPSAVDALLDTRGTTHGNFTDHARVTQRLKQVLHEEEHLRVTRGQAPLSDVQREAIEMNFHKIGRVLAGDADFADHWDDMAGYSRLVSQRA